MDLSDSESDIETSKSKDDTMEDRGNEIPDENAEAPKPNESSVEKDGNNGPKDTEDGKPMEEAEESTSAERGNQKDKDDDPKDIPTGNVENSSGSPNPIRPRPQTPPNPPINDLPTGNTENSSASPQSAKPRPQTPPNPPINSLSNDFFLNLREKSGKQKKRTQAEKERLLALKAARVFAQKEASSNVTERQDSSSNSRNESAGSSPGNGNTTPDNDRRSTSPDGTPINDENPEFAKIQREYFKKKANGTAGLEDDIKFVKAQRNNADLRKKREEDVQAQMDDEAQQFNAAGEHSIFVEDEDEDGSAEFFQSHTGTEYVNRSRKAPPSQKLPPLPRFSQTAMNESLEAGLAGITARHGRKNKTKNKRAGAKSDAPNGEAKKRAANTGAKRKREKKQDSNNGAPEPPKKRKKGRPKAQRAAAEGEIGSLFDLGNGNVLREGAAAANHAGSEPTLDDRNKSRALLSLISRVPLEDQQYAHLDKKALDEATKKLTWRRAQINVKENGWSIKGMTVTLKNFQLLGLARLRELERRVGEPKGGIIADSMGLGKTVSMLANIVDGAAHPRDPVRATLVVVPPAILKQWMREIQKHLEDGMLPNVLTYDGTNNHRDELRMLQNSDIVLTTYHTLRNSYPKNDPPKEMTDAEQIAWFKEQHERHRGVLHRVSWLRVVLDECNAIKNHKSQTAIAACGLTARHRWLVSGTIVTNQISEFFSYFKFLKAPCTGSVDLFSQNFLKDEKAQNRLYEILKTIMIRRTHKERLLGAPLVKLPTTEVHTIEIDFSKTERKIYEIIFKRCEKSVKDCAQKPDATPREIFCHAFLRLLFLRQLTGHFQCCAATLHKFLTKSDMGKLFALCANQETHESEDVIHKLREILRDVESVMNRETSLSARSDSMETEDDTENRGNSTLPGLQRILEDGQGAAAMENGLCAECGQPPGDSAWDTDCHHVLCDECLDGIQTNVAVNGLGKASCPACSTILKATQRNNESQGSKKKKRSSRSWNKEVFFHSSKTRAIKAAIMNWRANCRDVKIVIYTQFLVMSDIIVQVCEEENWSYLTYNGSMDMKAREKAIESFQDDPSKQILIASLKAGGVGLNLTQATRVLLVDLYWNYAVEEQAFCRVYRIGQTQHTVIHRFAIKETVDEELLKMQDRKNREIGQVLGGNRRGPIQLQELFELFGLQQDGSSGRDREETVFLVPNEAVEELVEELPEEL